MNDEYMRQELENYAFFLENIIDNPNYTYSEQEKAKRLLLEIEKTKEKSEEGVKK
jgi:hypothetical protein